ncbi:hypothetical protein ACFSTC_39810 [Nonomuraea ferruginea]
MLHDGVLDLGRFDPVAADLHLAVAAAQELERAVRPYPCQVARMVQARPGGPVGVGHEGRRGQRRLARVPVGQA